MLFNWIKFLGLIGFFGYVYAASSPPNKRQRLTVPRNNLLRRMLEREDEVPIKSHILIKNFIPTELCGNSIKFSIGKRQVSLKIDPETSIITFYDLPQGNSLSSYKICAIFI
jgi:hypothetical protein